MGKSTPKGSLGHQNRKSFLFFLNVLRLGKKRFEGDNLLGNKETLKARKINLIVSIILTVVWIALAIFSWISDRSPVLIWIFSWGAVMSIFFVIVDLPKPHLSPKSIKIAKIILVAIYIIVIAVFVFA